jgi:hypothetical protein
LVVALFQPPNFSMTVELADGNPIGAYEHQVSNMGGERPGFLPGADMVPQVHRQREAVVFVQVNGQAVRGASRTSDLRAPTAETINNP